VAAGNGPFVSIAENSSNKSFLGRYALLNTRQFTYLVENCSMGIRRAHRVSPFV